MSSFSSLFGWYNRVIITTTCSIQRFKTLTMMMILAMTIFTTRSVWRHTHCTTLGKCSASDSVIQTNRAILVPMMMKKQSHNLSRLSAAWWLSQLEYFWHASGYMSPSSACLSSNLSTRSLVKFTSQSWLIIRVSQNWKLKIRRLTRYWPHRSMWNSYTLYLRASLLSQLQIR